MDPIEKASRATNRGNAHRKAERICREGWRSLTDKSAQDNFWKIHWDPCIRILRRVFRDEFKDKQWKGLSIEWIGSGYSQNGVTREIQPWMHYRAWWKGMFFERHFAPKDIEDMSIEAWRLGAALAGCATANEYEEDIRRREQS